MFDPECLECDERCVGGTPDVGDVARAWLRGTCATGGGGVAGTSPGGSPDITYMGTAWGWGTCGMPGDDDACEPSATGGRGDAMGDGYT